MKKIMIKKGIFFLFVILLLPLITAGTIFDEDLLRIDVKDGTVCSSNGNNWINTDVKPQTLSPTTGPFGDCLHPTLGASDTCCPTGYICSDPGTGIGVCGLVQDDKNRCHELINPSDLTDSTECDSAEHWIEIISNEEIPGRYCGEDPSGSYAKAPSDTCQKARDCKCEWDAGSCTTAYIETEYCFDGGNTGQGTCRYENIDYDESKCDEQGFIYAEWNAFWDDGGSGAPAPADCVNTGKRVIPCPQNIRLGFFSFFNVISVVIILIIFYLCFNIRKNKK